MPCPAAWQVYTGEMDYEVADESGVESIPLAVRRGIRGADPPDIGARDYQPLGIALRGPDGALAGGLYGATMWAWLMIDGLWVSETLRGRGYGRRLLLAAEDVAVARECGGAWLGTFDFQARGFYERMGYTVCAELQGFPPGHTHFHRYKRFAPTP